MGLFIGFFNFVKYDSTQIRPDDSIYGIFESVADCYRAPSRWVFTELWGGTKKYKITLNPTRENPLSCQENYIPSLKGFQKVVRIIVGLVFGLFGQMLAFSFMAVAFISEEVRLKHKFSVSPLSKHEAEKLNGFISERQKIFDKKIYQELDRVMSEWEENI